MVLDFSRRIVACKTADDDTIEFSMRRNIATYEEVTKATFKLGEMRYRTPGATRLS